MRYAVASFGSITVVIGLLALRGAADWSNAFAECWYGLFAAAVILAVAGLIQARRCETTRSRVLAVVLSLPALIAVPIFIVIAAELAKYAD